jgi:hypothetical protein
MKLFTILLYKYFDYFLFEQVWFWRQGDDHDVGAEQAQGLPGESHRPLHIFQISKFTVDNTMSQPPIGWLDLQVLVHMPH